MQLLKSKIKLGVASFWGLPRPLNWKSNVFRKTDLAPFLWKIFPFLFLIYFTTTQGFQKRYKVWVKKMRQLHCFLSHKVLILAKYLKKWGQNKMSLALIWGILHSCRSNMIGDIMKNLKNWYFKKCQILQFFAFIKFASKK